LVNAIGAPGLTLVGAIANAISQTRRDALGSIFAALGNAEMLSTFLRWQYAIDITALNDQTRVYRDNSVAMSSTGVLLRGHGTVLVPELAQVLLREAEEKPEEVVVRWLPVLLRMPQFNRVVLRLAFLAARRKFYEKLTPLTAIGGVVMLRFVMPDVGKYAPALTKLLQQMMQLTVLSTGARADTDPRTLESIANGLTDLVCVKKNYMPRFNFSPHDVIDVIAQSLDEIKAQVKPVSVDWVHPVVYSLQELIETVFAGPEEDPKERLVNAVLF
jgi:hypothetical protein